MRRKPGVVFLKLAAFQPVRNLRKRGAVNPVPVLSCMKPHRAIFKSYTNKEYVINMRLQNPKEKRKGTHIPQ